MTSNSTTDLGDVKGKLLNLALSADLEVYDIEATEILTALLAQDHQRIRESLMEKMPQKQYMHQFYEGNTAEPPSRKEANPEVTVIRDSVIDQATKAIEAVLGLASDKSSVRKEDNIGKGELSA